MKHAAGLVIYRRNGKQLEVLLVHPSGNYNRHAPWSIPKGLPDEGESLADAATRETHEEAGISGFSSDQLTPLGYVDYTRSRKRVHAFAVPVPPDAKPCANCWEIERAEFLPLEEARRLIHPDQRALLDRLVEQVSP